MRVAFVTDLHITQARLKEHRPVLRRVALSIWDKEPDLLLVGGDLCGLRVPHRATPDERNALVDFLRTAVDDGDTPIVVVRGNHDARGDFDFLDHLAIDCTYMDEPGVVEGGGDGDDWAVMCLPWVDRTAVSDPERYQDEVRALYRDELQGYLNEKGRAQNLFVLGHVAIKGATLCEGQPAVPIIDPVIPLSDMDGDLRAGFFGHYHHPQSLQSGDHPIVYGGSLNVNEYGEDDRKAWVLWEDGGLTQQPIRGPRRVTLDMDDQNGTVVEVKPNDEALTGDLSTVHLKVRVKVTADSMDAALATAAQARAKYADQVASVRVEYVPRVHHATRDGADEVAVAVTVTDKVAAYFDRMPRPPGKRLANRALQLLDELQREAGGA
jgi:DNA repair exonuclease SbcCD nuclease subunit